MNFSRLNLVHLFFTFLCFTIVAESKVNLKQLIKSSDDDFCYSENSADCEGPSEWGGICNIGNQDRQSPINIMKSTEYTVNSTLRFSKPYTRDHESFWIQNNGHNIQISLNEDNADESMKLSYFDHTTEQESTYIFQQLHFHWGKASTGGSEHLLHNQSFAMEIHLVHFSTRYDELEDAVDEIDRSALNVIGIFAQICDADNEIFKTILPGLEQIGNKLPSDDPIKIKGPKPFSLKGLLPSSMDFYSYYGSLTTPDCNELVKWSVVQEPICITEKTIEKFRSVKDADNNPLLTNHRPIQDLSQRKIDFHRINILYNYDLDSYSDCNINRISFSVLILTIVVILCFSF